MSVLSETVEKAKKTAKKWSLSEDHHVDGGLTYLNLDGYFVEEGMFKLLTRNITQRVNTLLLGPTGVGKTELVYNVAKSLDLPLTILDMGTMTDPIMSLIGTHAISIKDGKTYSEFKRARFPAIIQQPGIVLLDELSRASLQANNLLFPVLDFRKELSMEYDFDSMEPVKIHPECVFIATANLGTEYTGTSRLDRALIDRFLVLQVKELPKSILTILVSHAYPSLTNSTVNGIVETYYRLLEEYKTFNIEARLSLRHLKQICEMVVDGFTPYDSFLLLYEAMATDAGKAVSSVFTQVSGLTGTAK